jgi:dTDP-4-amino-4,6-dideoxygalactose transaminase
MQQDLEEFENALAKYTGSKYAVGVANATDGLQIGLMAGGLKKGGEVIISSHTMIATASAIHFAGGVPVPVDCGKDLMIDLSSAAKEINSNTVAIMPTQLNGRTCNMDEIIKFAKKHKLCIYEDAAQALGSKFKDRKAGTFGISSAISLYPAKILGCLGDGGAILTDDKDVYERTMLLRDHGRDPDSGEVVSWGFNSRLDNIQAAFLNYFFSKYDEVILRRRYLAKLYDEGLKELDEIYLPEPPNDGHHFDVFQNYEVQVKDRNKLKEFLSENGIGTLIQWGGKAIHQFKGIGIDKHLPITDKIFSEILMLPLNLFITEDDVKYVIENIKNFYSKN